MNNTMSLDRHIEPDDLPKPYERQSQAAICEALGYALPPDCFWTAIPGGDRDVTTTPGYRAGTPDLFFLYRGKCAFIEMKREGGGRVTPEQKLAHEDIERAGGQSFIARTLEEVIQILREDLHVPVRLRPQ